MAAKIKLIVAAGLIYSACFSYSFASESLSIKDAFSDGKIKLEFEGAADNGKGIKIYIENIGSDPLKILVPNGETIFELGGNIKTISFSVSPERVFEVAPQKSESFTAQQTGKQRIDGGKMSAKNTPNGIALGYENLSIKAGN